MKIDLSKFDKLSLKQWEDKILLRGLHIKYKYQLEELKKLYPEKIGRLQDRSDLLQPLTGNITFQDYGKIVDIFGLDFCLNKSLTEIQPIIVEETEFLNTKVQRLIDKYATTLKEIELRDNKLVVRKPVGTEYYIDLTNGNDDRTGLKIGPSTIDSTADTTHFIDDLLTGADDYINGSYVWNVTRGIGALISDFVAETDEVTLATPIAGMTAGDTYYILDAWLTLGKYTTVTERTAGDVAKVRAGTTQVFGANLEFDEDGNADNLITIKGCDSVDDSWGDASDVRPILDFNNSTLYTTYLYGDHYWKFQNLDFKGGNSTTYGSCSLSSSDNTFFDNCRFYESGDIGLALYGGDRVEISDCEFYSNIDDSVKISSGFTNAIFKRCIFNGGADTTDTGITNGSYSFITLIDCEFGQTTAHVTQDINIFYSDTLIMRNCKYNTITWSVNYNINKARRVYLEDDGQVFEAHKVDNYDVTIERDTAVTRVGGADSSLKMTPSSRVGLYNKVSSCGEQGEIVRGTFKVWLQADVEKTINIYIKGFGWTGFPTAAQLFLRASYLSDAGNANRTEIDSDEVIADNVDFVPFQVTLTPARTGFVLLDIFIAHYEAASGINIDIDTSNIT